MSTHMLRIDIMMDLSEVVSPDNIKGASVALMGQELDPNQVAKAYGEFVTLLVGKGLGDRKNIQVSDHEVFMIQEEAQNAEEFEVPTMDDEVEEAEIEYDESVLQKKLVSEICEKAFQIVSEVGTIETILYNDESVSPGEIEYALNHVVGIEIQGGVSQDESMDQSEFSICYDNFGQKEIELSKTTEREGE